MINDLFTLQDKHIVITGACGFIGESLAIALADYASSLTLIGTSEQKLNLLRNKLRDKNSKKINTYVLDITTPQAVTNYLDFVKSNKQQVDGFVHCAMYRPAQDPQASSKNTFESSIYGNVVGSFLLWSGFSELMGMGGGGSLVYVGSIYGKASPDFSIYEKTNMSTEPEYVFIKEGMNGLSKYYANKYGHLGVRSNVVILGGVSNNQPSLFVEKYVSKVPLRRMANPQDIIGACIYLLSEASSYVTGAEIRIDGGYLSR